MPQSDKLKNDKKNNKDCECTKKTCQCFDFGESLKKMTNEGGEFFKECSEAWKDQPQNRKDKIKNGLRTFFTVIGILYLIKKTIELIKK